MFSCSFELQVEHQIAIRDGFKFSSLDAVKFTKTNFQSFPFSWHKDKTKILIVDKAPTLSRQMMQESSAKRFKIANKKAN